MAGGPTWAEPLAQSLAISAGDMFVLGGIAFVAGLVRGFSGFALSALVMASATMILPPVQLIPICWWLELTASVLMVRGGFREANKRVVMGLFIGSSIGAPLGMWATISLDPAISKLIALGLILSLALTQLAKVRLPILATRSGLYGSGLLAGIATGLASIGGMVVALYVLARELPARQMRASLVLFLFAGTVTSGITWWLFGVMDQAAVSRGLLLSIPVALGVILGKLTFTPRLEPYYRPFCLILLVGLAGLSLIRTALGL